MRFFERWRDFLTAPFAVEFRTPVCVSLTNVARWLYEENPRERWDWADFPNLAPPWPCAWYEWNAPAWINSEGRRMPGFARLGIRRLGAYVVSARTELTRGWATGAHLWAELPGRRPLQLGVFFHVIDAEGRTDASHVRAIVDLNLHGGVENARSSWTLLYPYYLGVSFTHCANVEVVDRGPA